mmetsp:Transcript_27231/g.75850  ORF Transcript_27231/g.75850 Transcript_27231/m.75850 type:complete len:298 (-) Transcript_27231:251-1144(-)
MIEEAPATQTIHGQIVVLGHEAHVLRSTFGIDLQTTLLAPTLDAEGPERLSGFDAPCCWQGFTSRRVPRADLAVDAARKQPRKTARPVRESEPDDCIAVSARRLVLIFPPRRVHEMARTELGGGRKLLPQVRTIAQPQRRRILLRRQLGACHARAAGTENWRAANPIAWRISDVPVRLQHGTEGSHAIRPRPRRRVEVVRFFAGVAVSRAGGGGPLHIGLEALQGSWFLVAIRVASIEAPSSHPRVPSPQRTIHAARKEPAFARFSPRHGQWRACMSLQRAHSSPCAQVHEAQGVVA